MKKKSKSASRTAAGAIAAEKLAQPFPRMGLAIQPPYPPAEAKSVDEIPTGPEWQYEPKWDGFRCLAFRKGKKVVLQSKAGQPLGRYFPELVAALERLTPDEFVLDAEIVIFSAGRLSFDDLLQRIHPAESRIRKLASATPAVLMSFDLLVNARGKLLTAMPLSERRQELEKFLASQTASDTIRLSPASNDRTQAKAWMGHLNQMGLDGVVAKLLDEPYRSGERTGMVKIKRIRTADCVVGGFRYAEKGGAIGSLLLGLYNEEKLLDHVGFTSSFTALQRTELKAVVEPLAGGAGFTGKAPGGPSRWSTKRSSEWQALDPKLVCEVHYDHFSGGRFRHGTKFLRWRPEKKPRQCTYDQLQK